MPPQTCAQMQTEMSRGPLAEDEHSRKEMRGGAAGLRLAAPPSFLFCRGHPLPFPLHFCLHLCAGLWGHTLSCCFSYFKWSWNACIHASMHPCIMHGCMDAWMHGCMDAWMLGCMWERKTTIRETKNTKPGEIVKRQKGTCVQKLHQAWKELSTSA